MFFQPFNKRTITWNIIKKGFEKKNKTKPTTYTFSFESRKKPEVLFSFTNIFAFLIKHIFFYRRTDSCLMFGRRYGTDDFKERTMESTDSFSIQA